MINKLNELAHKYFNNINNLPALIINNESCTVVDPSLDAFALKPCAGATLEVTGPKDLENSAICRSFIGIRTLEQAAQDENFFVYIVSLHINAMLTDLIHNVGSLENRTMTLAKPGPYSSYFRDLGNSTGYELRLWSEVKK